MRCRRNWISRVLFAAALLGSGAQVGAGCGGLGRYIANINPCGTILNCDPVEYRFVTSGYEGPGVDPKIDPACTYPPFCEDDPFVSSGATQ